MCGGSWKLVLRYVLAGEAGCRREKSQAIARQLVELFIPLVRIALSHGLNQDGKTADEWHPRVIRSIQGIQIIHATIGPGQTMLMGSVGVSIGSERLGGVSNVTVENVVVDFGVLISHCSIAIRASIMAGRTVEPMKLETMLLLELGTSSQVALIF